MGVIGCKKPSPSDFEATVLDNKLNCSWEVGTLIGISTRATSCIITVIGPEINASIQEAPRRL